MKISSVLNHKGSFVATVRPNTTVAQLLATLAEHQIGAVVVVNDNETIAGVASERDIARWLNSTGTRILDAPVSQIMSRLVATCTKDSPVEELMVTMTEQRVRHVPVMEDDRMIGIVSIGDIVKARIEHLEDERKSLLSYISS